MIPGIVDPVTGAYASSADITAVAATGGGAEATDPPTAGVAPGVSILAVAAPYRRLTVTMVNMAINIPAASDVGGTIIASMGDSYITLMGINCNFTVTRDGTNIAAATNVSIAMGPVINSSFPMATAAREYMNTATLSDDVLTDTVDQSVPTGGTSPLVSTYPLACDRNVDMYLNAGASNTGVDDDLLINGTIDIYYIDHGDQAT